MPRITLSQLKKSACAPLNPHLQQLPKSTCRKISKEKSWMEQQLSQWCRQYEFVLSTEHKFHTKRRWRFDWSINSLKIAIEYEGIFSEKSRHTTFKGYSGDTDKYRAAAKTGWEVWRYTARNYKELANDLNDAAITKLLDK